MKFKRFGNGSYKSREIEQNYSTQIICKGFSNTRKLVPDNSEENYSINRRVEVVFY
jgi:flagellar motor protein MotB